MTFLVVAFAAHVAVAGFVETTAPRLNLILGVYSAVAERRMALQLDHKLRTRLFFCTLKVAQNSFLFFNTNSLMDRYYHTFSFVSLKTVSNKCPIIGQQVLIIFPT